jgi:hypothetical protein
MPRIFEIQVIESLQMCSGLPMIHRGEANGTVAEQEQNDARSRN